MSTERSPNPTRLFRGFCAGKDAEQESRAQGRRQEAGRHAGAWGPRTPGAPSRSPGRPPGAHTQPRCARGRHHGTETPTCRAHGAVRARTGRRRRGHGEPWRREVGRGAVRRGRRLWEPQREPGWESELLRAGKQRPTLLGCSPFPVRRPLPALKLYICGAKATRGGVLLSTGPVLGAGSAPAGPRPAEGAKRGPPPPGQRSNRGPGRAGGGRERLHLAHSWARAAAGTATCN